MNHWNRQGRRSGGSQPAKIVVPKLDRDDVELLKQEAEIRREFGEEGVKRFWEELEKREKPAQGLDTTDSAGKPDQPPLGRKTKSSSNNSEDQ